MAERDYDGIFIQGIRKIPHVAEIRAANDSVSFIANYGNEYATQEWHTVFYVSGWYECLYVQGVEINDGILFLKGDPRLHIMEISETDGLSTSYSKEKVLKGDEINQFIKSGFNVTVAGFKSDHLRPRPSQDLMSYWHAIYPDQM